MSDMKEPISQPVEGIQELPRSIEPGRDLWPGIEARLAPRSPATTRASGRASRRWGLGALAASVAAAFLAGLLLGRQAPEGAAPSPGAGTLTLAEAAAPALAVALEATEREYRAAFKSFGPVGLAPTTLQPETLDALARTWQSMKEAESALLTALDEHPENPYLADKLFELRGQQLEFMRDMHMLEQNNRRET
jgi:hypothetical protein